MKKLYRDEIAFALEMISEGWQQQYIAAALSVKPETLRSAIRRAEVHGSIEKPHRPTTGARIKHTNARAAKVLAAQSRANDLPTKNQGGEGRDASASPIGISRLGQVAGDHALRAKTPCQS